MLNQVDFSISRPVDPSQGNWDVGFKLEMMYGTDGFFTHSNGILDQSNKSGGVSGPNNQPDLLQAYVSFGIPLVGGLTIDAGKFEDVLGYERINPTQNAFYTHSYGFSYGLPFTETGLLATYHFLRNELNTDSTTFTLGITRGWNQSIYDNNSEPDGLFKLTHHTGPLDWQFGMIFGPEGVLPYGPPDNHNWWGEFDANGSVSLADNMSVSGDVLIGNAESSGTWCSIAGYFHYQIDPHVALNARGEFYHDGKGLTTGVGGPDLNYWEATLGLAVTPMPGSQWFGNLMIRPELRYDWADQPVYDFVNFSQLVAAVDVTYRF